MNARRVHPDLPIFRLDANGSSGIYVPGLLTVMAPDEADALLDTSGKGLLAQSAELRQVRERCFDRAHDAAERWVHFQRHHSSPNA